MNSITAFLRARLDEDERFLRTVAEVGKQKADNATAQDMADAFSMVMLLLDDPRMKALLARWESMPPPTDTTRLLREVEAKHAILANIEEATSISPGSWLLADKIIRHLAAIYSDHPDYDPGLDE